MRTLWCLVASLLISLALCPVVEGADAHLSTPAPKLDAPTRGAARVVLHGTAPRRSRVVVQVRARRVWHSVVAVRAGERARFRVSVPYPATATPYRVVANRRASNTRTVAPLPLAPPKDPTAAPATDACGVRPTRPDGSLYSCAFVDQFEGDRLDTAKWLVQETWYSGMTSANNDCYVNDPGTVSVRDGMALLTSRRNLDPFVCQSPSGAFTTTSTASTIATYGRFNQTYGRFSFRAKMPPVAGIPGSGSGLWLYPQKLTYGPWPKSGEIDVAEWFSGRPGMVYPSVHYEGEVVLLSSGMTCSMPTATTQFHTYTVEWTSDTMRFFYDDHLCWTHRWAALTLSGSQPFDKPFYLVMTQAWGAGYNAPTAQTPTSATLSVDWVKAWA